MFTDEEKSKLAGLLQGLEVPEVKLTERCSDLVKDFQLKYSKEVEEEESKMQIDEVYENPYKVDKSLLEENERKLRELMAENKGVKKQVADKVISTATDPKRPWRTNSNKEKLLRINIELKQHHDRASQIITPLDEGTMISLIRECQQESATAPKVAADRLRDTVYEAKKNLSKFQYRNVHNSTATAILHDAHEKIMKSPPSGSPAMDGAMPVDTDSRV